jgi:hypothetical protein
MAHGIQNICVREFLQTCRPVIDDEKAGRTLPVYIYMESIGSEWKIGLYLLFRHGDSPLKAL